MTTRPDLPRRSDGMLDMTTFPDEDVDRVTRARIRRSLAQLDGAPPPARRRWRWPSTSAPLLVAAAVAVLVGGGAPALVATLDVDLGRGITGNLRSARDVPAAPPSAPASVSSSLDPRALVRAEPTERVVHLPAEPMPAQTTFEAGRQNVCRVGVGRSTQLRSAPDPAGERLTSIPRGSYLVFDVASTWIQVEDGGERGWIEIAHDVAPARCGPGTPI